MDRIVRLDSNVHMLLKDYMKTKGIKNMSDAVSDLLGDYKIKIDPLIMYNVRRYTQMEKLTKIERQNISNG